MKINLKLVITYLIVFASIFFLYYFSSETQTSSIQLFYTFITFSPAIAGSCLLHINGIGNKYGKTLLLLTIGFWFWAIAECVWYLYRYVLGVDPYPSVADLFFLIPYPLFFAGIYIAYKNSGASILNVSKKFLTLDVCIITTLSLLVAYFGIYRAYNPEVSDIENSLSFIYGIVDLVLVAISLFIVSIIREFRNSKLGSFWIAITLGFLSFFVADVLFAIYNSPYSSDIKPYTYIDLFWIGGYLLLSHALIDMILFMRKIQRSVRDEISNQII
jgi:hypothetical protein